MKNIKFLMLLIVVLSSSYVSIAQIKQDNHITGHVIDKATGKHIPFATIIVIGTNKGAITDATGHYMLANIKTGEYRIEASYVGYKSLIKDVTIVSNKMTELLFELEIDRLVVDDIIVSSTRNNTKRKESPTLVGVINSKQFDITSSKNVAEVLNFQPGLRVDHNCSNCGYPQLRINGLPGQYSQMLLDSRPIFSSLSSVYGLEQLPTGMIDRVEVIRGGGSALFGSSAIGGVINIITKEPSANTLSLSNILSVAEGGEIDNNTTLNASLISPDNKFGAYVFAMTRDRESYDRDGDGFSEVPLLNSTTIGFKGFYRTSLNSKLTLEYHNMGEYRRGGDRVENPPHQSFIAEELTHKINGGGVKFDIFSEDFKHKFNTYVSAQQISRDSYYGTDYDLNAYGKSNDLTANMGMQYSYSIEKFLFMPSEVTIGTEYTFNEVDDKMVSYSRDFYQKTVCYGGYLQNEWKNEQLSILLGARLDKHNKVDEAILSPRANIRYTPHENVIIRGSYSSGYRPPQAYDEDLHISAVGGDVALIVLSEDLNPEYSKSLSMSFDLYNRIGDFTTNLLLEGFYTRLDDVFKLIEIGEDKDGNTILERQNADGLKVMGLNTEIRVTYKSLLNLQGGYTYQQSKYNKPEAWSDSPDIALQRTLHRSPDHYAYMSLNYTPSPKWMVSTNAIYTGSMLVPHYAGYVENDVEVTTPSFWDISAKVSRTFRLTEYLNFELSGGVKNILDAYQDDIDQGITRDAKYIYGPNTPRTYYISLKFSL